MRASSKAGLRDTATASLTLPMKFSTRSMSVSAQRRAFRQVMEYWSRSCDLSIPIVLLQLALDFCDIFDMTHFEKESRKGQLVLKYTGKRRRKPQERIIKCSWDYSKGSLRLKQVKFTMY